MSPCCLMLFLAVSASSRAEREAKEKKIEKSKREHDIKADHNANHQATFSKSVECAIATAISVCVFFRHLNKKKSVNKQDQAGECFAFFFSLNSNLHKAKNLCALCMVICARAKYTFSTHDDVNFISRERKKTR